MQAQTTKTPFTSILQYTPNLIVLSAQLRQNPFISTVTGTGTAAAAATATPIVPGNNRQAPLQIDIPIF
jgi:hypothetical protein